MTDEMICYQHGKPFALADDWDRYDEGEGEHLCWDEPECVTIENTPIWAADRIAALSARVTELETALAPFAKMKCPNSHIPYSGPPVHVTCGECITCVARSSLAAAAGSGSEGDDDGQ